MTDRIQTSESVENFLKAIYALQQDNDRVSTNTLSEHLNITALSVTDMAKRLNDAGLVDYLKHHGVILTPDGEKIALHVVRRHRLIELFLVNELGYALPEVHQEAEALEHAVSNRFIEAIAHKLGDPDFDPHGDPIPNAEGIITERDLVPLSEAPVGGSFVVRRLNASNADMLLHILERGFKLDAQITVLSRDPFHGPISVAVDGKQAIIGSQVAHFILVEPV